MHPLGFCLSLLLGLVSLSSLSPMQAAEKPHILLIMAAVSYTHLTLPTIYSV